MSIVQIPRIVRHSAPLTKVIDLDAALASPLVAAATQPHVTLTRRRRWRQWRPWWQPRLRRRLWRHWWRGRWHGRRKRVVRAAVCIVARRWPHQPIAVRHSAATIVRARAYVSRYRPNAARTKAYCAPPARRPLLRMRCPQPTTVVSAASADWHSLRRHARACGTCEPIPACSLEARALPHWRIAALVAMVRRVMLAVDPMHRPEIRVQLEQALERLRTALVTLRTRK